MYASSSKKVALWLDSLGLFCFGDAFEFVHDPEPTFISDLWFNLLMISRHAYYTAVNSYYVALNWTANSVSRGTELFLSTYIICIVQPTRNRIYFAHQLFFYFMIEVISQMHWMYSIVFHNFHIDSVELCTKYLFKICITKSNHSKHIIGIIVFFYYSNLKITKM